MARPRGKINIACQNPDCKYYLVEKGKDIIKKGWNRAGHQQYFCYHCNRYFVETANTPLYYRHLSEAKIVEICKLLVERNSIRGIERITGHHRDTISSVLEDLALHASYVNDFLLRDVKLDQFEADELWSTVKKNKRKLSQKAKTNLSKVMRGYTPA